jgi:hypothetical protein
MNEQIKAGADIHAGDGGYREGTQEGYNEFVAVRNRSVAKMRIRELMEQAGTDTSGKWMSIDNSAKFAELIVRECVGVVEGGNFLHDQAPTAIFARECSAAIKRHFGVE